MREINTANSSISFTSWKVTVHGYILEVFLVGGLPGKLFLIGVFLLVQQSRYRTNVLMPWKSRVLRLNSNHGSTMEGTPNLSPVMRCLLRCDFLSELLAYADNLAPRS